MLPDQARTIWRALPPCIRDSFRFFLMEEELAVRTDHLLDPWRQLRPHFGRPPRRRLSRVRPQPLPYAPSPLPIDLASLSDQDYADRFGLLKEVFEQVWDEVKEDFLSAVANLRRRQRIGRMSAKMCFALAVQYLHDYLPYKSLRQAFQNISCSVISEVVKMALPILRTHARFPFLPDQWRQQSVYADILELELFACIDGSLHLRDREHPGQKRLYSGYKKKHCVSVQLICHPVTGDILWYAIMSGHNNDQGCVNQIPVPLNSPDGMDAAESQTLFDHLLALPENSPVILGDGGYSSQLLRALVTPASVPLHYDAPLQLNWVRTQRRHRAIVERVFGRVKTWAAAEAKSRHPVHEQVQHLMIIYWLVSKDIASRPLVPADQQRYVDYLISHGLTRSHEPLSDSELHIMDFIASNVVALP